MQSLGPEELKALWRKAIGRLWQMPLILGLVIFVAAWAVNFWGAWLYLAIFLATVTGGTLDLLQHDPALMARRMEVGPAAEPERSQQIIQGITGVFSCAVLVVSGIEHRIHGSAVAWSGVLAANCVFVVGLVIVLFVFRANSYTAGT